MFGKRGIFLFVVLGLMVLSSSASAFVGISPSSFTFDYEPGADERFSFKIYGDGGVGYGIRALGDFAEYVELDKNYVEGPSRVQVTLNFPQTYDKPGVNKLLIEVVEQPEESFGFSMNAAVRGLVKIKVPYPNAYAEVSFGATDANAGEPIEFTIRMENFGSEELNVESSIDIYDSERQEIVDRILLEDVHLDLRESKIIIAELSTGHYSPGTYVAVANFSYAGINTGREAGFRLGELRVGVASHTEYFTRDEINRFEILSESFWNDPISEIYAEVEILGYDKEFITRSTDLGHWERKTLTGFFDTTGIEEDEFQAKIVLHYEGRMSEKIVNLRFVEGGINVMLIVGGVVGGVLVLTVLVLSYLFIKNGRRRK